MKKGITIVLILILLVCFSTVGYHVVSANERVQEVEDMISQQNRGEKYFSSYDYTIDNPCIIINPYYISPLTALVLFETNQEVNITLSVMGKDDSVMFQNTFQKSKKHYIPVYGLYPDFQNKIILSYGNTKKELTIQTDKLPSDFEWDREARVSDQLLFINNGKYPYAIDKNHDVRWYFNKQYSGKISRLGNGHLLLGNDLLLNNKYPKDIMEIDLLGKIYYQYNIDNGYYGSFVEDDTNLFVLSDDLLKIDKQSGVVLDKINLEHTYDKMMIEEDKHIIKLSGSDNLIVNTETLEVSYSDFQMNNDEKVVSSALYYNDNEFKITEGVKFSSLKKTSMSKEKFWLVGYQKPDKKYNTYHIHFLKEDDYFKVDGQFDKEDKVYIILDQFMDKRVYEIKDNQLIIQKNGLNGKYSIYMKINDLLYKTNHYVTF